MLKIVSIIISLGLLALIYSSVDQDALVDTLRRADPVLLMAAAGLLVPPFLLTAWRLSWLAPTDASLTVRAALRLTLVASVLNMVLPSKMGDLLKAFFLRTTRHDGLGGALALVIFEKGWDTLGLVACGLAALLLVQGAVGLPWWVSPILSATALLIVLGLFSQTIAAWLLRSVAAILGRNADALLFGWRDIQERIYGRPARTAVLVVSTIIIWMLHLAQVWTMARAIGIPLPFVDGCALIALAMLAGLLPLTFAGVGTRDAAFVVLLAPYCEPAVAAALGLLFMVRLALPALLGLAAMPASLATLGELRAQRLGKGAGAHE